MSRTNTTFNQKINNWGVLVVPVTVGVPVAVVGNLWINIISSHIVFLYSSAVEVYLSLYNLLSPPNFVSVINKSLAEST